MVDSALGVEPAFKNHQYVHVWGIQVVFSDLREAPNEGLTLV